LATSETGLKGIEELEEVFGLLESYGEDQGHVGFDVMLARGLTYYTGAIFEVKVNNVNIGSVSGGGRYDNLTGGFGLEGVSGVGFSFGVDRIYDVMEELSLFPESKFEGTKVLITFFDKNGKKEGLNILKTLRKEGISSEIYPDAAKIKKQFSYADKKQIPFVIILGSEEIASGKISLKNLATGKQEILSLEKAVEELLSLEQKNKLE
jgi:histidyl-tRNA synthetase